MIKNLFIIFIFFCITTWGQTTEDINKYLNPGKVTKSETQNYFQMPSQGMILDSTGRKSQSTMGNMMSRPAIPYSGASEGLIDSAYLLGPGDLCAVMIKGAVDEFYSGYIGIDGNFVIPGIGITRLGETPLNQAEKKVKELIQGVINKVEVQFSLIQVRAIKVYISGETISPGMYELQATDRLSTLIQSAGGLNRVFSDSKKVILNWKGTIDTVDYSSFINHGNLSGNPVLKEGISVYIPPLQLSEKIVVVRGMSLNSGYYNITDNEKLSALIERVGVHSSEALLNKVYVKRDSVLKIINLIAREDEILQNGDEIYLTRTNDYIYITGQVNMPGAYPYIPGLTVRDYIGMAGGLSPDAVKDCFNFKRNDQKKKYKYNELNVSLLPGDQIEIEQIKVVKYGPIFQIVSQTIGIVSGVILTIKYLEN